MRILAYNAGHDGAVVLLEAGRLQYALEAEKDDGVRHSPITASLFLRSLQCSGYPDAIAISGWQKNPFGELAVDKEWAPIVRVEAGYYDEGSGGVVASETMFAGRSVRRFSSSHVRSHIMCSYGLSPFPQGQPCYVLLWEGAVGAMYFIDSSARIRLIGEILSAPGHRYTLSYVLADPNIAPGSKLWVRPDDAGKVMALAAYGRHLPQTSEQKDVINKIINMDLMRNFSSGLTPKSILKDSKFCDIGVDSQEHKDLARHLSDALFDRFFLFAKERVKQKLPLLISGGCGLNCEWNSKWHDSGLFSDVFVPPCTNDSGVALGAAIDAMHHYTGNAKIEWTVYAGEDFVEDVLESPWFTKRPLELSEVSQRLMSGDVIAWVQGRYELGPRALGNRSLIAAPFSSEISKKLNRIKQREDFRPIAPMCLEEDLGVHFHSTTPSPHMLYFQWVKSPNLKAITHIDGSCRVQTVNEQQNPEICALLREFRRQSGVGVLCNTSLNFKGRGFVNRLSQLFLLAQRRGIDGLVVGKYFWQRRVPMSEKPVPEYSQGDEWHQASLQDAH